jgi:hypothetical protein
MMRRIWCALIGKPYVRDRLMEKRRAAQPLGIRTLSIDEILMGLDREEAKTETLAKK